MPESTKKAYLSVELQFKKQNGILVTAQAKCDTWEQMQKFLNDFEHTLLKGNNGKP